MFSRLIAFVVWVASFILVVLSFWPQILGWQRTSPWSFVVAFRGLALVVAIVAFVVLLVLGLSSRPLRRVLMGLGSWLIIFAVATGGLLYLRGFGTPMPEKTPTTLRVLEWNTQGGAPAPEAVAQLILETNADIVALPETTGEDASKIVNALAVDGVAMQSFTVATDGEFEGHSTSLLIAPSVGEYRIDNQAPQTAVSATLVARPVNSTGPIIIAAHSAAPDQTDMSTWRDDLKTLADMCTADGVILAGDLNATIDNMQGLGGADFGECRDGAVETSGAAVGTWPASLPALLATPIDHILASPMWIFDGTQVITTADSAGSDHRPLLAQIRR